MPIYVSNKKFYSTVEVAEAIGRARHTLLAWGRNGKYDISKIERDKNNNRLWTDEDIEMLRKIRDKLAKNKLLRGVK